MIALAYCSMFLESSAFCETDCKARFESLKQGRDKAAEVAVEAINQKYIKSLEPLLKQATQAGQLELALRIKMELDALRKGATSDLIGRWKVRFLKDSDEVLEIKSDGTALFHGKGAADPLKGKWLIEGEFMLIRWSHGGLYRIPVSDHRDSIHLEQGPADGSKWQSTTATRVP